MTRNARARNFRFGRTERTAKLPPEFPGKIAQQTRRGEYLAVFRIIKGVDGTGESWEKSYTSSSVDEILSYIADIKDKDKIKVVNKGNTTPEDFPIEKNSGWEFEICGREGIFEPKIAYTFEETDARSCTFNIQPCVLPVTVYGGYPEYSEIGRAHV